jgi:hypothetical protein
VKLHTTVRGVSRRQAQCGIQCSWGRTAKVSEGLRQSSGSIGRRHDSSDSFGAEVFPEQAEKRDRPGPVKPYDSRLKSSTSYRASLSGSDARAPIFHSTPLDVPGNHCFRVTMICWHERPLVQSLARICALFGILFVETGDLTFSQTFI